MTCFPLPNYKNRAIIIPMAKRYYNKFHTLVLQRDVVINIAAVSHHPPPIKIVEEKKNEFIMIFPDE